MHQHDFSLSAPAEHPGGCGIARLASGKRVLSASEPLDDVCRFHRADSVLLIGLVLEGTLTLRIEGRQGVELSAGQFGIHRSLTPFGPWRLEAQGARFAIIEGPPHVASVCPVGTGDRDVPACLCCPNYRQAAKTLVASLPEKLLPELAELTRMLPRSFGEHLQMEARILHLIGELITDAPPSPLPASGAACPLWLPSEDRARLEEVGGHLRAHLGEDHSLAALGERFHLNEFKLKAGFKLLFGDTVFRYLRQQRMEQARRLIERGDANVTEIALEVGYSNPSQFAAAFAAHWGIKPKQYQLCCRLRRQPAASVNAEP